MADTLERIALAMRAQALIHRERGRHNRAKELESFAALVEVAALPPCPPIPAPLERKHATFRPSELPVFGPCGLGPVIVHRTGEPDTLINRCPRCADSRQSNTVLAARHYEDICAEFLGLPDPTARDEYDVRCNACGHVYAVDTGAKP